ncbi:MAG TPA: macro domain-containing protein [Candidatus Nitrosotenuis sp.]|nr:macro domain-containing protein [Candidatus Nitrosotenuis sp.]
MPINFVSGNIFLNDHNVQAFAHGCNCQGVMGAGIAVRFKKEYPEMFNEYRRRCKAKPRQFNVGDAFLWKEKNKPFVFNLGTQEAPGRHATYQAVEQALANMMSQVDAEGITSIAIPRIGAGYGGLKWEKVRKVIEKVFEEWSGNLFVYEGYQPE